MKTRSLIYLVALSAAVGGCTTTAPVAAFRFAKHNSAPEGRFTFISPDEPWAGKLQTKDETAAAFAKSFQNAMPVAKAEVFATALGVFELYLNGVLVTVDEDGNRADFLRPGATDPVRRRQYVGYDLTDMWRCGDGGENEISAFVARSWFSDALGGRSDVKPAFAIKLRLTYADGSSQTFDTDESWRASFKTPFRRAGIYWGEDFDGGADRLSAAECADAGSGFAKVNDAFKGAVVPQKGPGVSLRRDLELPPVGAYVYGEIEIDGDAPGDYGVVVKKRTYDCDDGMSKPFTLYEGETLVVDFGQNAAAVPRIVASAARGVTLTFRGAEALNDGSGERKRGCDGPSGAAYRANLRSLRDDGALVRYTFGGTADGRRAEAVFMPSFTYMGYRYGELTATGTVTIRDIRSVPVTSVAKSMERGTLTTGNKHVNKLLSNIRWGMYSNYISIPTDCPQRDERMGWTANAQVFAPSAFRIADVHGFLSKWMGDMRDAQSADKYGRFPGVAPLQRGGACGYGRFGWADAGVAVPWTCWRMAGDRSVLRENWESMCKFVDWQAKTKYRTVAADRSGGALYQRADWLSLEKFEPHSPDTWSHGKPDPKALVYWDYLAGCHWMLNASRMATMATAIGKAGDAARFSAMARDARAYLRKEYFRDEGKLPAFLRDMQTPQVFALHLALYDDSNATDEAVAALVKNIQEHGTCLQTGLLGTPLLLDALTYAADRPDVAYTLLLQHKHPSWLHSVDQGATTAWERWDGITKDDGFGPAKMNSLNHCAQGAVLDWLYATAAGIQPGADGGFDGEFNLAPITDMRLKRVEATYRTSNGTIVSSWKYVGGKAKWTFTVPPGAVAHVFFAGVSKDYGAGTYELEGK